MLKAGVISLGCVKNLVDTEVMLGILRENKIDVTAQPNDADIIIINTCTFIESAKEEGISTILQMADFKISGKCRGIIVAGCLGQRYKQELLDELPEVDAIIGTGAWDRIMEAVEAVLAGERLIIADKSEIIYDDKMPRILTTPRYTAYVKVAEGCDNRCAYCVIPLVRGNFRSRTIESIVAETKNLVKNGVKEINLIAQDTTNYGIDLYGEIKILELLKELVKIEELKWIRLLYCYPKRFTDELLNFMATEPKICKYIDLPLQHAHNDVLKAMARQDTKEEIEDLAAKTVQNIKKMQKESNKRVNATRVHIEIMAKGKKMEKEKITPKFMRAKQLALHLGIGLSTVWAYVKQGKITANKISDRVTLFDVIEVEKALLGGE